jgi:hypothetical protein
MKSPHSEMSYTVVIPIADRVTQIVALEQAIEHGADQVRVPRRVLAELLGLVYEPGTGRLTDKVSLVNSARALGPYATLLDVLPPGSSVTIHKS